MRSKSKKALIPSACKGEEGGEERSSFRETMMVVTEGYGFILRTRSKYEKAGRGTRICFCFCMEAWQVVLFKIQGSDSQPQLDFGARDTTLQR